MKYLTLIRHAKSDWEVPGVPDHERPLNERGLKAAPRMGRFLAKTYLGANGTPAVLPPIDEMISSTAVRALSTAKLLAVALGLAEDRIVLENRAYLAEPKTLLKILQERDDAKQHLVLVGHNPGITEFADRLIQKGAVGEMPTCAVALIELPVECWALADWKEGRLIGFVTPRLIEKRFLGEVMEV